MEAVVQHVDLGAVSNQGLNELFYYENRTHFFLGPYRQEDKDACFGCFTSVLKQNSIKYYDILITQPACDAYYQLLKEELNHIIL